LARKAGEGRISRGVRRGQARLLSHRTSKLAGHQRDHKEHRNRDEVCRAVDYECAVGRGEKEIVSQDRGDSSDKSRAAPAVNGRR
jgi:hypothetical protein